MRVPARLRGAYARTDYEAAGVIAHIGRRCAAMDALLARLGTREAAFVTAWNPWSRRMPRGWNDRMAARLDEAAHRLPRLGGWGRARMPSHRGRSGRGWAEQHLLIAADRRVAARLARRFRQNAMVVVRRGACAELVLLALR